MPEPADLKVLLAAKGLTELAAKLAEAGYREMADLGANEEDVKSAITAAAGDDWKKPGEINRAVQLWVAWKKSQDAPPPAHPPEPIDCPLSRALSSANLKALAGWLTTKGGYREFGELGATEETVRTAVKAVVGDAYSAGDVEHVVGLWREARRKDGAQGDPVACALTTALMKNNLRELAVRLTKAGYREMKDLGDKEEAVRNTIVTVVGKQYQNPGEIEQVVGIWKALQKKTGTILDLPSLKAADPDGKGIDLSAPALKIDDVVYKFPDSITATKSDDKNVYKSAGDLSLLEWTVIAKRTGLLHALDMEMAGAAIDADSPVLADLPALVWKPKEGADIFKPVQIQGDVTTEVAYTASTGNLVHSKITNRSLNLQTPFCSASAEMSRAERSAKATTKKLLFVSGRYQYIYAILKLKDCVAPHDALLAAIDAARKQSELAAQADALETVFRRFGHLVPETVTLGGELYFTSTRETSGEVSETSVKDSVAVAVKAKYEGFGGGVGAANADANKMSAEAQQIFERARSCCSGGDGYLAGNPKDWPATTRDANKWAVIRREGLRPLISFLDDERRSWVERVWGGKLKSYWGGANPPAGYVKPDMDGLSFVVRSDMDRARGLGLLAALDPKDQPVALVDSNMLAQPIGDRLAWKLRYSGCNTDLGAPLYFIVEALTDAQKAARAAAWKTKKRKLQEMDFVDATAMEPVQCARLVARLVNGQWKVVCEQVPEAGADQPMKTNPAAWTLTPVNLEKRPTPADGVAYIISNCAHPALGFGAPGGIGPHFVPLVEQKDQRPWFCHVPR